MLQKILTNSRNYVKSVFLSNILEMIFRKFPVRLSKFVFSLAAATRHQFQDFYGFSQNFLISLDLES